MFLYLPALGAIWMTRKKEEPMMPCCCHLPCVNLQPRFPYLEILLNAYRSQLINLSASVEYFVVFCDSCGVHLHRLLLWAEHEYLKCKTRNTAGKENNSLCRFVTLWPKWGTVSWIIYIQSSSYYLISISPFLFPHSLWTSSNIRTVYTTYYHITACLCIYYL